MPTRDSGFTVRDVERLLRIKATTLRAWERRYGVIQPRRLPNGYRMYSDTDVALLARVKQAVDSGVPVRLAFEALRAASSATPAGPARSSRASRSPRANGTVTSMDAGRSSLLFRALVDGLTSQARSLLDRLFAVYGIEPTLFEILTPMLAEIAAASREGAVTDYQAHSAHQTVRERLLAMVHTLSGSEKGPAVALGCVPGEFQEIDVLMLRIALVRRGTTTLYVGANPPAKSLRDLLRDKRPAALALSSAAPARLRASAPELRRLVVFRNEMTRHTRLVLGGPAVAAAAHLGAELPGWDLLSVEGVEAADRLVAWARHPVER